MSKDQVDLFNGSNEEDSAEESNKSYRDLYVGEGKKFKDDEALARAKWHSDQTIAARERELAELRAEFDKRLSLEELLAKIEAAAVSKANNQIDQGDVTKQKETNQANLGDNGASKPGLTKDDINQFVREALSQESMKRTVAQNGEYVRDTLKQAWGSGFSSVLEQKATSLGMTKEEVSQLAGTKPDLLLAALGVQKQKQVDNDVAPMRNSFNAPPQSKLTKNFKYFEDLRKKDIRTYMSVAVQKEMFELAKKYGDDFYK